MFGFLEIGIAIVFSGIIISFYAFLLKKTAQYVAHKKKSLKNLFLVLLIVTIVLIILPPQYGFFVETYTSLKETWNVRFVVKPYFPDNNYTTTSTENIFMLQLESGNALALLGNITRYEEIYIPTQYMISQDGIFYPFFWGNGIQTNRAQETILCGITANIGKAYSYSPTQIKTICLPEILGQSGYKTLFFNSLENGDFANTAEFMRTIGFEEVHGKDIMNGDEIEYSWGYDDCAFYERVFLYITTQYPENTKLFVYIIVDSHHVPFDPKQKYAFTHYFFEPQNFLEKYINSAAEQDYCIATFYNKFKEYQEKAHLFIFPDHSWPVGLHGNTFNENGAFNDNFLTFLTYIPPKSRKNEFQINKTVSEIYGQADLIPTIFELLNNKTYQNSFFFSMKEKSQSEYEHCHILVQPYDGGAIVVIRGMDKYIYYLSENIAMYYDLRTDWYEENPILISNVTSYDEFKERYYCERYSEE